MDDRMIYLLGPETVEGKARFRASDRDIVDKFIAGIMLLGKGF